MQAIPAPSDALYGMLGCPARTLRPGTPEQVGLLPGPIAQVPADVDAGTQPQGTGNHPLFPGAVSLVGHDGRIVSETAHGYAVVYSDDAPTLLPRNSAYPPAPTRSTTWRRCRSCSRPSSR